MNEDGELQFDKEVDFHHQIAYSFEKAARFQADKKPQTIIDAANNEIVKLVDTQSWIIDIDPMIIFYCLYFSVYYQNHYLMDFLESYVKKRELTKMAERTFSPGKRSRMPSEQLNKLV